MTDRYTKLVKQIPTIKTSVSTVVRVFFEQWVAKYGVPFEKLTNHGPQFVSRYFLAVFITPGMKNIIITK